MKQSWKLRIFIFWAILINIAFSFNYLEAKETDNIFKYRFEKNFDYYNDLQNQIKKLCFEFNTYKEKNTTDLYKDIYNLIPDHPLELYLILYGWDFMNFFKNNMDVKFQDIENIKGLNENCQNFIINSREYIPVDEMYYRLLSVLKKNKLWSSNSIKFIKSVSNMNYNYNYSYYFDNKIIPYSKNILEENGYAGSIHLFNERNTRRRKEFLKLLEKLDYYHVWLIFWTISVENVGIDVNFEQFNDTFIGVGLKNWDKAIINSMPILHEFFICATSSDPECTSLDGVKKKYGFN